MLSRGIVRASALAAAFCCALPCDAQVVINEILGDPGIDWNNDGVVSFKDDEWVEIVNAGPAPVDMASYRLSDGGTRVLRFGFTGVLQPGATRVVFGSESVAWESANSLTTAGLSLNNAGDTVRLWQVAAGDTTLVDAYTYAGFEILDDRSVGRLPDGAAQWRLWDARNPYSGMTPPLGTGCAPTPGGANECPTAVRATAWSAVKRLYDATVPKP